MHVIVGITGGIAAYKATTIIRLLTEAGHTVKVIPTQNALRFIGATTLEALSHNSVDPDLYTDVESVKHVELGKQADLIIVAPATASFLARYAAGIADDLLGNTLLVAQAPIVVAPAMHSEMWNHPATQLNVATLKSRGVHLLAPASGRLTGADSGVGRLPEAEQIVEFALQQVTPREFANKKFIVTAGGTREPIDPVRFIGNRSSGKQGLAIAREAKRRGARVILIAANIPEITDDFDAIVHVATADDLQKAVTAELAQSDCLVMASAVADFRVENSSEKKLKRSVLGEELNLKLISNPDILGDAVAEITAKKYKAVTVGFAAETAGNMTELEKLGMLKMKTKNCDVLVANDVSNGAVFDSDFNSVLVMTKTGRIVEAAGTKELVAAELLDVVADLIK